MAGLASLNLSSGELRVMEVPPRAWMAEECDRASRVLHSSLAFPADGGVFASGVLREIDRESSYRFVQTMFSPVGGGQ